MIENIKSFEEMGKSYQEKTMQALIEDSQFAKMMADVFNPKYFTFVHLKEISKIFFDYNNKYKNFPTANLLYVLLKKEFEESDPAIVQIANSFFQKIAEGPLTGDMAWIQETSLEFCKRQEIISAMAECLDQVENKKYDSIQSTIRKALDRGCPNDFGHNYEEDLDIRAEKSIRCPISTGWPVLDSKLGGGWERKTITTFIAPTGAGKTMFLTNCAAALIKQGHNVLYVTLEMADFKIGLRADSWFSGLSIDDCSKQENRQKIKECINNSAKGRLIIKEWPTKRATTETIRSFVQRLQQTKGFKPDAIIVDYPDLLRPTRSYGEKRHELEGNYEELRGLGQELDAIIIVADQTNRSGLDLEVVTISSIAEAYSKATVCDLIITVSRTQDDKANNTGRILIAKSRLGSDGIILPFYLNTSKNVIIDIVDQDLDQLETIAKISGEERLKNAMRDRLNKLT